MSENELPVFLKQRSSDEIGNVRFFHPGIIEDAMQCPYIAIDINSNIIGCMVYANSAVLPEDYNLFFEKTCRTFYCRSAEILDDREILFAAELAADWYYYPLLINEVHMLRKIMGIYSSPGIVEDDFFNNIKKKLLGMLNE